VTPSRLAAVALLALVPLAAAGQGWEVPDAERERKNPLVASRDVLKKGGSLYKKHCASCHGPRGKGDGPASGYRAGTPIDLTLPGLWDMPDGEMFWKISTGLKVEGDVLMPAFTKEMPNELDRWRVVLFVRTLHQPRVEED
jgi:mono/diheme cytochrome c family protein